MKKLSVLLIAIEMFAIGCSLTNNMVHAQEPIQNSTSTNHLLRMS